MLHVCAILKKIFRYYNYVLKQKLITWIIIFPTNQISWNYLDHIEKKKEAMIANEKNIYIKKEMTIT